MSIYRYSQSNVIDEVTFKKSEGGHIRAYLHAKDGTSPEKLEEVQKSLAAEHYECVPITYNGKPVLQVYGFKTEPQLIHLMEDRQWLQGASTYSPSKEHDSKFIDKVKKRSLFASGLFYVIGDIKFISYGVKGETPLNVAAGAFYGAGTASSLLFGRKDPTDLQIHELSQKMADYVNSQHIAIPKDAALSKILDDHDKGLIRKADHILRRYPAELMNSFFAIAGICIAVAAHRKTKLPVDMKQVEQYVLKQESKIRSTFPNAVISAADKEALTVKATKKLGKLHHTSQWLDVGLGSMTAASGTFSNLIKEKAHDPDAPEKHGLAGAWEWVQQRPLTIAGVGYMVSTLCHAASTGIEWGIGTKNAKEAIFDRGVFVVSNLIAEVLVAISSKGHGSGVKSDGSVDETVIATAADFIAKQPPESQEDLIGHVAQFLGRPDTLALKDDSLKQQLHHQVELMRKNPWAVSQVKEQAVPEAAPVSDKSATVRHAAAVRTPKALPEGWQNKVAKDPGAPSPQISA